MCVLVECNVELPWIACITIPNLVGQNGGTRCSFALWEERRHHVVLQLANLGFVQTVGVSKARRTKKRLIQMYDNVG
jgi:hypothetical protein